MKSVRTDLKYSHLTFKVEIRISAEKLHSCKCVPRSEVSIECPTSAASMFSPSDGKPMDTDWVVSIMASWVWAGWRDPCSLTIVE